NPLAASSALAGAGGRELSISQGGRYATAQQSGRHGLSRCPACRADVLVGWDGVCRRGQPLRSSTRHCFLAAVSGGEASTSALNRLLFRQSLQCPVQLLGGREHQPSEQRWF